MDEMNETASEFMSEVPAEVRALVSKLVDSELSQAETKELTSLLNRSPAAQRYYLCYLQLHSELSENGGAKQGATQFVPVPTKGLIPTTPTNGWTWGGWSGMGIGAGVTLCLVAGIGWLLLTQAEHRRDRERESGLQPLVSDQPSANPSLQVVGEPLNLFTPSRVAIDREDLAVIVRVSSNLSNLLIGRRLPAGTLNLDEGELQIEFMGGAVVALSAPAELKLISKDSADLISGIASARVPERARGFTLNAPGAAVVDLGTEFVVEVSETGSSKVRVLDGEVELSLLGDDGNTLTSHRLRSSAEVEFDGTNRSLSAADSKIAGSPRVAKPDLQPLQISDDYARLVMESQPIAYWRFESPLESDDPLTIPNQMGNQLALHIRKHAEEADSVKVENGQLSLRRSRHPRYLIVDEPLQSFTADEFTAELWMRPDDLQHATCLSIFPSWSDNADAKLSVIEIVTDTFLIHQPGSVRALYRNPPVQSPDHGVNLFTPGMTSPGRWQHVALIKSSDQLSLYFDGQLIKSISSVEKSEDQPFQLHLGQLSLHHNLRQFSGLLDEVAIYNRALNPDEIRLRYEMMSRIRKD